MAKKKLSEKDKYLFAWKFLKRNPRYRELYGDYVAAKKDWLPQKELNKIHPRSKRNERIKEIAQEKRGFASRFTNLFSIKIAPLNPYDNKITLTQIKKAFDKVVPVGEFALAPDANDNRLFLVINTNYGGAEIETELRNLLRQHRDKFGIVPRQHVKTIDDLELYLEIADTYSKFLSSQSADPLVEYASKPSLRWSEFSKALNLKGYDTKPTSLRKTVFKAAMSTVLQSPYSILP